MDLQADLKWIVEELKDVQDPKLIEKLKTLLKNRKNTIASSYELSADQKSILDQRLADHKANPNKGRSWESLRSDLRSKYEL